MKSKTPLTDAHQKATAGMVGLECIEVYDFARNLERQMWEYYNARLREHIERLTHLLRESAKGNQWPSPLEIDAALNKSQAILSANTKATDPVRDAGPQPK